MKDPVRLAEDIENSLLDLFEIVHKSEYATEDEKKKLANLMLSYGEFISDLQSTDVPKKNIDRADSGQRPLEAGARDVFQAL